MTKLIASLILVTGLFVTNQLQAQCPAPTLTPIGTVNGTFCVDVLLATNNPMFELCYQNPGAADSVKAINFCPDPLAFSSSFTSSVWSYGIKVGAQVWVNQYCIPVPYYMGPYFTALYNSCKQDTSNWVKSNVITVTSLPGTAPAKGKKK